ncbi:hypothetical protein QQP08_018082 [Theobroma cacao]|nr:hypothetical protein QQP08_016162 [Theobroma cacao]WRX25595.1 hypothetical protein QQP08_018082 [Theobroma cacao]
MERLKLVQVKWHQEERNGQNTNIYSGSVLLTYIHYLDIPIKDFQPNITKLVELTISTKLLQGILLIFGFETRALFDLGSTHSFVSPCFAAKLGVDHTLMEIGLGSRLLVVKVEVRSMANVPIVKEFLDDTRPISIPPYHITLVELKDQLEDLLDKG